MSILIGPSRVGAVIVTHNSDAVVGHALGGIRANGLAPENVWVVDSGSASTAGIHALQASWPFRLLAQADNVGFARANNLAVAQFLSERPKLDFCLFVNPDLKLPPGWVDGMLAHLDAPGSGRVGLASTPLLSIDLTLDQPTGFIDSLGIEQMWFGQWHDVGQREPIERVAIPSAPYSPLALCAALMVARRKLVEEVWQCRQSFFDESFFMYKEDIEISLLARRLGWDLRMFPDLKAFHQRGWCAGERGVRRWQREISARNDLVIAWRYRKRYLPFAALKWVYVHGLEATLAQARPAGSAPRWRKMRPD